MRMGSMTILFREQNGTDRHIGYTESLTRLHEVGFSVADLNLCQLCADKTELHKDNWQPEAEKIAVCAKELGMALPQCHLPFKSKKVRWREPEDYEYYVKMFYRAIDVASYIGIPWGVIHPEVLREADITDAERLKKNHELNDCFIEYALKRNVSVAYENALTKEGNNNYCSDAEQLCELIDSYNDPRIGACWDTGHANTNPAYRDQSAPLRLLGHRLRCTHIDDNRGRDDLHLTPFLGTVKWDKVISALREINYPGDLILELSVNYRTPDSLKEATARYAYRALECVMSL